MTRLYNSLGTVPDGATITIANSGGSGLNALSQVSTPSDGTFASSSLRTIRAHRSIRITTGATTQATTLGWSNTVLPASDTMYVQEYVWFDALPAANTTVVRFTTAGTSNLVGSVIVLTTGFIRMTDALGATVAQTASAIPTGQWVRIQARIQSSPTAGNGTVRFYSGVDLESSTTPTSTATSASSTFNTSASGTSIVDTVRFGQTNTQINFGPLYIADVEAQDTAYPAPLGSLSPPTANAGSNQTGVAPGATVTLNGAGSTDADGTITTYNWAQTAGPTVTLSSTTTASPTFTAPTVDGGTSLTFSLTVTDNDGLTSTPATVSITVLGPTSGAAATRLYNSFGGVADGATLSVANSATAGSDAFGAVSIGSDASVVSTGAHVIRGRRSLAVTTGTANAANFGWNAASFPASNTDLYTQAYLYIESSPAVNLTITRFTQDGTTNANMSAILLTTGAIRLTDSLGATMATLSAADVPQDQWVRLQLHCYASNSAGFGEARIFSGANLEGTAPSASAVAAASFNTLGPTVNTVRFGITTPSTGQGPIFFADVEARSTQWPVALGATVIPPTANAGLDKTANAWDTVTLSGSGTAVAGLAVAAYKWNQAGGPAVTLSSTTAQSPTFAAPAAMTNSSLLFALTVTDSAGVSSVADTVAVTVNRARMGRLVGGVWVPQKPKVQIKGSVIVDPGGGGTTPPVVTTDFSVFATSAQITTFSTVSAAALIAKGIADGVKNGTYVGGSTALTATDIRAVDNRVGPIALTTALWWKRTGDASYLAPLKTFILNSPKVPDTTQALNHHRAHGGLLAAIDVLNKNGQWDWNAVMPNYGGVTAAEWLLGGSTYPDPLKTRVLGAGRTQWQTMRGCSLDAANNWGGVARFSYLMYAVVAGDTAAVDESVKMFKKSLGDQTTGMPDYNKTADYNATWDNWGLTGTTGVKSAIGKTDAARPGLDGAVIEDIARGGTNYSATADQYGATGLGVTYPLENAEAMWWEAAALVNLGYNVRTFGEGGNALRRMGERFWRTPPGGTQSQFVLAESQFSIYKNHRWLAERIDGGDYGTPVPTNSGTGTLARYGTVADWVAGTGTTWGAQSTSKPSGVRWEGTGLQGFIPPYSQTDIVGGTDSPLNEWSSVEMDSNTVALNNKPTLSFVTTPRYNARPGKSVQVILRGRNSTGTSDATKRAQFRVNPAMLPYWTPTDNGNDNEVWFGWAFHLGAGYVISDLTAAKFHNLVGFRHFTSVDPTFYYTIESEDGGIIERRSAQTTGWSDGLGDQQRLVGVPVLGWNTMVIHAKLSRTTTNALREVWVNGVYGGSMTSMNITGSSQIRLRMGPYTDTSYLNDRTFTFANARVGTSFASVDPDSTL